jgi:hypothetical protein
MSRPATSRLKVNEPLGAMPVLQFCTPAQLQIDPAYQRSLEAGPSQTLIRRIAQFWNWDLCQPLVVARRADGALYVVDGQHRLAAAVLRRDIAQLPCVITSYRNAADEAASFVALNQQRRPLSAMDIFKAAIVAEDETALAIVDMLSAAGLSLAPHSNHTAWKPGMVANVGGIQGCYRQYGPAATAHALEALGDGFRGEVLRYAGTIFGGLTHICGRAGKSLDLSRLIIALTKRTQSEWMAQIRQEKGASGDKWALSASAVIGRAYHAIALPDAPAPTIAAVQPRARMSFAQQMEAVANGAKLVEKFDGRRADPEGTLGGIGSAML